MTDQEIVKSLLAETERLWLLAVQARRAAAAKQREYTAALLEWTEAEAKNKNGDDAMNQSTAWEQAYELSGGDSDTTARLARRLAMLDAAEAALAGCGLTGIYDDFSSPANAIKQIVERLAQLEGGQALQAERQLRREAEAKLRDNRKTLTETEQDYSALMRRHGTLDRRTKRTEALAALVTLELAALLEKLANYTQELAEAKVDIYAEPLSFCIRRWLNDAKSAFALAARIREALDEH